MNLNVKRYQKSMYIFIASTINQIKSLLLSHHHSTSALVSEILKSVLQTVQKKQKKQFTYGQYIFTDYTEDNMQNTHTYTQYTQCTINTIIAEEPLSPSVCGTHPRSFSRWGRLNLTLYDRKRPYLLLWNINLHDSNSSPWVGHHVCLSVWFGLL